MVVCGVETRRHCVCSVGADAGKRADQGQVACSTPPKKRQIINHVHYNFIDFAEVVRIFATLCTRLSDC
ncbi:hypothetical protein AGR13a_Cc170299 [Agrobacterium genomosp. 13 str. CFBP 6927]|uniref:Uncharacterized protein n=1 Tax=Agrobacterium genomosp. 13 str. CFBP 6927 TaxID=1183428 RepID=A0ABM9VCG3_9HYPH|nr:hypothetical protein AGR13a_Cc170299 [Agrobacterium genomosp. 13 str. CFBP 6927]